MRKLIVFIGAVASVVFATMFWRHGSLRVGGTDLTALFAWIFMVSAILDALNAALDLLIRELEAKLRKERIK